MKFGFEFSNLCGTVYQSGNVIFTPDGRSLISPVGNRVTVFDLVNHVSTTLPFEAVNNLSVLAISEDSNLLIAIDEVGKGMLINFPKRVLISTINLNGKVKDLKFSPDGRSIAVAKGDTVEIISRPEASSKNFDLYTLKHRIHSHCGEVLCVSWSRDSRNIVSVSRDMTARVHTVDQATVKTFTLAGHKDQLRTGFFGEDDSTIYTVGRDGFVIVWKWVSEVLFVDDREAESEKKMSPEGRWTYSGNHFFNKPYAKATCASFHPAKNILVIGFSDGVFGVYEMPSFTNIHTLSMSKHKITTTAVNSSGDWLAFGCAELGQLLVWEWTSESYILKQQGHTLDINTAAYSPDGQYIVTGSDDGKVKAWNASTGFCFITFSDHTAPVKAVAFLPSGNAVVSASLDGTVRAYDLVRYRNYRTFTTPEPRQFTTLAIDPSGEIVCAGTQDDFSIAVWSMQNGRLLEILSGHEGPVSCIAFHPLEPLLASSSWDKTVRLWDVFEGRGNRETFTHTHEVLSLTFNAEGSRLCSSTLDGSITIWDPINGNQLGIIEGRRDLHYSHPSFMRNKSKNLSSNKYFASICFSVDGSCIIGGGNSPVICIYQVDQRVLVKRFITSNNANFRGTLVQTADSAGMRIFEGSDDEQEKEILPGARRGDLSERKVKPELRTNSVSFSPTGRAWVAATTEGLLIYSLDDTVVFDPLDLELEITPDNIRSEISGKNYARAILMALRLNEKPLIQEAVEAVPVADLALVTKQISYYYLPRYISFLSNIVATTRHLEFYLICIRLAFNFYGKFMKENVAKFLAALRNMQKNLIVHQEEILKICEENIFALEFLVTVCSKGLYTPIDESIMPSKSLSSATSADGMTTSGDSDDESAFVSNFDISAGLNMYESAVIPQESSVIDPVDQVAQVADEEPPSKAQSKKKGKHEDAQSDGAEKKQKAKQSEKKQTPSTKKQKTK